MSAWRSTGLCVAAAAVLATTGAARVPDGEGLAHAASSSVMSASAMKRLQSTPPSGSVEATVPVAAFGPADGAPKRTCRWPGLSDRDHRVGCSDVRPCCRQRRRKLRAVGRDHPHNRAGWRDPACTTRSVLRLDRAHLTIAVTARTHDGGAVTAAYNHSSG